MIGESSEERHERLDVTEHKSLKNLENKNIKYKQLGPYHYLVADGQYKFDYWPRTGLFINRKNKKRGRGVFNLIKILKKGESK